MTLDNTVDLLNRQINANTHKKGVTQTVRYVEVAVETEAGPRRL